MPSYQAPPWLFHTQGLPGDLTAAIGRDLDAFVGDRHYADDRTLLVVKRLEKSP